MSFQTVLNEERRLTLAPTCKCKANDQCVPCAVAPINAAMVKLFWALLGERVEC